MDRYISPAYIARLVVDGLGDEQGKISIERLPDGLSVISFTSGADKLVMAIGKRSETCALSKLSKKSGDESGIDFTKALAKGLSNKDVANVFIEEALGWKRGR